MKKEILNPHPLKNLSEKYKNAQPFPHVIIDNFFKPEFAKKLEQEFPNFNSEIWNTYNNAIEVKKTCNNWNSFPPLIYKTLNFLNSGETVLNLSQLCESLKGLVSDPGLNGGGLHIHSKGGKLNTHLDYSLHPKLQLQRRLNLIVYLNSNWKTAWGGGLGLWSNESSEKPGELRVTIEPIFNRCVIFDTTQNSWHGLPDPLTCPSNQFRKSLAVYYLMTPQTNAPKRDKAMFSPTKSQENDAKVLDLIKLRSSSKTAHKVWDDNN